VAGVTGTLLVACAGYDSGDNSAEVNQAPLPESSTSSRLQGKVSQSPVVGATVWVDRDLDNTRDFGETFDLATSNSGLFTLDLTQLDAATDYRLVSTGGTARALTAAAVPVGVMLAPRGARNITPLTTVVALNTALAANITTAIVEDYDVNIASSNGVSPIALRLAKGIETFMHVFGRNDAGVLTSVNDQIQALTFLATRLATADLTSNASIATAVDGAVDDTIDGIPSLAFLTTAIKNSLRNEVSAAARNVMDAITSRARTITEASIIGACSNAFALTNLVTNNTLGVIGNLTIATASGKVVQSAVSGATVFIDLDNDLIQDANEAATTTGADGSFTLSYDNSANPPFFLQSFGGTKTDSSGNVEPASWVVASKGDRNITYLTTLVAVNPGMAAKLGTDYDIDLDSNNGVSAQLLRLAKVVESYAQAFSTSSSPYFVDRQDQHDAILILANALDSQFADSNALLTASATDIQTAVSTAITNVNSNFGITVDPALRTSLEQTAYLVAFTIPSTTALIKASDQTLVDSYISTLQTSVGKVTPETSNFPAFKVTQITAADTSGNTVANSALSDTTIEYGAVLDNLTFRFSSTNLSRDKSASIGNFTVNIVSGTGNTQLVVPQLTVRRGSDDILSFSMTDNTTVVGSTNSTGIDNTSATFFSAGGNNTLTLNYNAASVPNFGVNLKATDTYSILTSGKIEGRPVVDNFSNTSITVRNPSVAVSILRIDNTTGLNLDNDTDTGANTDNITIDNSSFTNIDNITMVFSVADLYDGYSYSQTGTTIGVEVNDTIDNSTTDNRSLQLTLPTLTFARAGTHGGAGHSSLAGTLSITESTDNITVNGRQADNSSATAQTAVLTGLTGSTDNSGELTLSYDDLSGNVTLTNLLNLKTFGNYTITIFSDNSSVFNIFNR
jgi:hypothetical protein